jgi:MFS-type transporter involved in bile tolerance (Atg22 family)
MRVCVCVGATAGMRVQNLTVQTLLMVSVCVYARACVCMFAGEHIQTGRTLTYTRIGVCLCVCVSGYVCVCVCVCVLGRGA